MHRQAWRMLAIAATFTRRVRARITNSGDNVTLQASDADSIFCSTGSLQQFTLGTGGYAS
ncbi:MAG: hypothetical protein ACSLEN_03255 [Candidatus Malihini olakiniferum]